MANAEIMLTTLKSGRARIISHPIKAIIVAVPLLVAVTGRLSYWSLGDIAFTTILAVAIALWGYYGILRIQRLRYRPADAEKWSRVSRLKLWEAACVYDDVEPYLPLLPGTPCYATLLMLKSEHMNGRLSLETEKESCWQSVRLEDLRELAVRLGHKSKCLFPDERPPSA